MEKVIATKKWTRFDANGDGHLMVEIDGEEFELDTIVGAQDLDMADLTKRIDLILKINGIEFVEPVVEEKPKRKYVRHVNLGFAKDFGKVVLKLASPEVKFGYILYLKGTKKFVYRIDKRGIYVMEDNDGTKKTKPIIWSEGDIKIIKNIDDFDKVKVEVKYTVKNRLS